WLSIHDLTNSLDAIVDPHERTNLTTVAPNLYFVLPAFLGLDHLPANRGRRFLASACPCAVRPIHVMQPSNARVQAVVLPKVKAHPLREKLFFAVSGFGIGWVSVRFLQCVSIFAVMV